MKRLRIFRRIMKQTNLDRMLISFGVFILIAALALQFIEPEITNYEDAIWYCFVTLTTVGYGDIIVQTLLGRIISILLMLSGILVVSFITGTLVNYYNEISKIKNQAIIKDLVDKLENLENLSQEELKQISTTVKEMRNHR